MPAVNKTKYAILGILSFGPRSGYDIKRVVDQSLHFFWRENFGHIYPILARLEQEGLIVKSTAEPGNYPARNVYTLTEAGRSDFLAWLREAPEESPVRNEMLLKLFFGRQTDPQVVEAMILAEKKKNEGLLAAYDAIARRISARKSEDYDFWNFTLQFGVRKSEMIVSWCDETLRHLNESK